MLERENTTDEVKTTYSLAPLPPSPYVPCNLINNCTTLKSSPPGHFPLILLIASLKYGGGSANPNTGSLVVGLTPL